MKPEVLQTLLTAKVLLGKAQELCFVEDKFTASSGLLILQDAIELIFIAVLVEKGVDENKSLETFSFDQLIGELKKQKIRLIKSGTLKALNKQRVIIKHYGQVSEPQTVGTYYSVAHQALNDVLSQVLGKQIDQILLNELIRNEETNQYLSDACDALDNEKYFKCLTSIRKAIFIEIEQDYCVYEYRNGPAKVPLGLVMLGNGWKAPYYTRNKEWIEQYVNNPFDYIQIDHDKIRQDLLEWGASTQDFWNIRRLTPEVMRLNSNGEWLLKGELKHVYHAATRENSIFCLDRAITLLSKKQSHRDLARWLQFSSEDNLRIRLKTEAGLYKKASSSSEVVVKLSENSVYNASWIVPGLDGNARYAHIFHTQDADPKYLSGYVDLDSCELLESGKEQKD